MKHINLLIKPASSLCNMRCSYCFYADISIERQFPSYGVMTREITDKIIDNIFKDIEGCVEITFGFQGGEPTLAGLPWFRHFIETVALRKKNIAVNYNFQTNGLLLDDAWCEFFLENNFLVGLSIDAGKHFHNRYRFSVAGEKTWDLCLQKKELLDKNQVKYNILCVLTNDMAKEPDRVWRFIVNENVRFIQFIPCLESLDPHPIANEAAKSVLRPAFFAKFYSGLLPLWIKEVEKENYISVKFFDDVANYFFKGIPTVCGIDGRCHNQCVIEADGSAYPCDFYCFDQYRIGNLTENTIKELFIKQKTKSFLFEKPKLPKICDSCRFFQVCRGGCKRMHNVMYSGADGVICGFGSFLEKCLEPLEFTIRRMLQKQQKHKHP